MGTQSSAATLQPPLTPSSRALSTAIGDRDLSCPSDRFNLLRRFDEVFDEGSAIRKKEIEEAYRLRYQVYCLDRGFEEASACPDGMERDGYDDYALHSLLRERSSQRALGTVRLVRPSATPNWISKLPLAEYADIDSIDELMRLPAGTTAEVSRFAISRTARTLVSGMSAGMIAPGEPHPASWHHKLLPYMSLGLIRGLIRLSKEHGIMHWCLAAEPSLLRRLRSFGLHFKDAGPLVEHRGLRQICYAELDSLLEKAEAERPEYWDIMTEGGALLRGGLSRNAAACAA